ncbi:MAG: pseudouridine synthase [Bacilli bacterium]
MERLQKLIAQSGYCSRRKAEELIKNSKVKVNGKIITELGTKVNSSDQIFIDNKLLSQDEKLYFLLNKPRGVISSSKDDKNRKTVVDLIETDKRIYPIGRLDYDTTGILLLTNDGDFANEMMHPSNEIDKVYIAKVNGILKGKEINQLKYGVIIDGKKTSPAKVKLRKIDKKNNTCIVELIIHEGRNHQVKKMFEAVGFEVLKLKREKFGFLTLKGLNSGEYRSLSKKEISKLHDLAVNSK